MKRPVFSLVYFIVSIVVITLLLFARFDLQLSFNPFVSIIIVIAIISIALTGFLIYASLKTSKSAPFPLGLPDGSIRALIALMVLVFFVLVSIALYLYRPDSNIAQDIIKTIATLLIAVSAFYFGSKATEQGSKIATEAFSKNQEAIKKPDQNTPPPNESDDVPADIIQSAIAANGATWKDTYKAIEVKVGKKVAGSTVHELNALIFIVESKKAGGGEVPPIPPTISYNFKGKDYKIPTDVQDKSADTTQSTDTPPEGGPPVAEDTETPIEIDLDKKSADNE